MGLPKFEYHGIKREFYLFSFIENLIEVISNGKRPIWYNRPFNELVKYWKERWAIPRGERMPEWKDFSRDKFFKKAERMLEEL